MTDYMDTRVPQGAFADKVNPDIDDFTDETLVVMLKLQNILLWIISNK